jgi:transposase InsO family protein
MSRPGNWFDNVPMESFWGSLKNDLVYHRSSQPTQKSRKKSRNTSKSFITGNERRSGSTICRLLLSRSESI